MSISKEKKEKKKEKRKRKKETKQNKNTYMQLHTTLVCVRTYFLEKRLGLLHYLPESIMSIQFNLLIKALELEAKTRNPVRDEAHCPPLCYL
jgi:hypothetical protein